MFDLKIAWDIITTTSVLAIANKLLGKTADTIAGDLANLYTKGRDMIIVAASRKITEINDGQQANLRVARDVFFNGSFTDDAVCAEYFGGILASSRSDDGKDDSGVYYVDIIKSLSSHQLLSHYIIYRSLNKLWIDLIEKDAKLNVGIANELRKFSIWFAFKEIEKYGITIDRDFIALHSKGLISDRFEAQDHELPDKKKLLYAKVSPSMLGLQLYAVIHNRLSDWRSIPFKDFGELETIKPPKYYALSLNDLIEQLKIQDAIVT